MIIHLLDLGQKKIKFFRGEIVDYNGEILDGEKATGFGEITTKDGKKYSGHFVEEMFEGACESTTI